jgi:hypothetical protein
MLLTVCRASAKRTGKCMLGVALERCISFKVHIRLMGRCMQHVSGATASSKVGGCQWMEQCIRIAHT